MSATEGSDQGELSSHADWLAELSEAQWVCPSCNKPGRGLKQTPEGFLVAFCPCKPDVQLVFSWVTGTWRDRRFRYRVLE